MPNTAQPEVIQLSLNRPEAAAVAGLMTFGIFFLKTPPLQLLASLMDKELLAATARLVINRTGDTEVFDMTNEAIMADLQVALQSGNATVSAIIRALHPESSMPQYPAPHRP